MQSELYPSPHFEGVEKRIEINFRVAADDSKKDSGEIIPVAGGPVSYTHLTLPTILLV